MKVSQLRKRLQSIDGNVEVKVILNDHICKEIEHAYLSLGYDAFTIHIKHNYDGE